MSTMQEFISRVQIAQALNKLGKHADMGLVNISAVKLALLDIPAADTVGHAHWFVYDSCSFGCSHCGAPHYNGCDVRSEGAEILERGKGPKFCSECGYKMDEGKVTK